MKIVLLIFIVILNLLGLTVFIMNLLKPSLYQTEENYKCAEVNNYSSESGRIVAMRMSDESCQSHCESSECIGLYADYIKNNGKVKYVKFRYDQEPKPAEPMDKNQCKNCYWSGSGMVCRCNNIEIDRHDKCYGSCKDYNITYENSNHSAYGSYYYH